MPIRCPAAALVVLRCSAASRSRSSRPRGAGELIPSPGRRRRCVRAIPRPIKDRAIRASCRDELRGERRTPRRAGVGDDADLQTAGRRDVAGRLTRLGATPDKRTAGAAANNAGHRRGKCSTCRCLDFRPAAPGAVAAQRRVGQMRAGIVRIDLERPVPRSAWLPGEGPYSQVVVEARAKATGGDEGSASRRARRFTGNADTLTDERDHGDARAACWRAVPHASGPIFVTRARAQNAAPFCFRNTPSWR